VKGHLFQQDAFASTWLPYSIPHIHNLEWDPREEHEIDFPHAWVLHPMAVAVGAFLQTLTIELPIKPGAPDPYTPLGRVSCALRSTSSSASSPGSSPRWSGTKPSCRSRIPGSTTSQDKPDQAQAHEP
jgi:hypothetical protein